MDTQEIEREITRRINERRRSAGIGSKTAKAKLLARASELSELQGWIRNAQR